MRTLKDSVLLPNVSAEAWCVFDTRAQKVLHGRFHNNKREVASLTKMMTFLVSYNLQQKFFPELTTCQIEIPKYCTLVGGTTANLRKNDSLTLLDLYYGLLLPSGNDAAMALADHFGRVLQ